MTNELTQKEIEKIKGTLSPFPHDAVWKIMCDMALTYLALKADAAKPAGVAQSACNLLHRVLLVYLAAPDREEGFNAAIPILQKVLTDFEAQVADKARREGLQRAINLTCTYCADGREIIDRGDGGIWHFVARGDDLGDTEPCTAHKLYRALQSRKTDGVG